jgi:YbdK family carboxylate-amine ligase
VETNTPVAATLDDLRDGIVSLRRQAIGVAESLGLGLVAAGTVPLVDLESLPVTPTSRYRRMLDDYQLLVREQLICGAQVHVGIPDRDEAVSVAQRVMPVLPVLLALSASSPYWMGEDSGYASTRSLIWMRWPTAGDSGVVASAEDHDALVADLNRVGHDHRPQDGLFRRPPVGPPADRGAARHRFQPGCRHRGAAGRALPRPRAARPAGLSGGQADHDDPAAVAPGGDVAGRPLRARG